MARLIVIEGVDASGKETQTELLRRHFEEKGRNVKKLTFPDYSSPSSALVKMYLGGKFGSDPNGVNPYAASLFYAVDRFASFNTSWSGLLNGDCCIIADRYVTSNIIYQAAKFEGDDEKLAFIEWIEDLEYNKLRLPRPDTVIFLNMEPEAAAKLMAERRNKITDGTEKDIHEKNAAYLKKTYATARFAAKSAGWTEIKCSLNGQPRSIEDIHRDIISKVD